jgi:hypothetical protein
MTEKKICPFEGSPYKDLCPMMGTLDPKKIREFCPPDDASKCEYFQDCTDWVTERTKDRNTSMINRVNELAKQAGFLEVNSGKFAGDESVAKFAELIIQQCANIAKDCYEYHQPLSTVPHYISEFKRIGDTDFS